MTKNMSLFEEFMLDPEFAALVQKESQKMALEDERDRNLAEQRLAEIKTHPEKVLSGPELEAKMTEWNSVKCASSLGDGENE